MRIGFKLTAIAMLMVTVVVTAGCGRFDKVKYLFESFYYKGTTYADNPTDGAITFTLDGKSYTLAAHSMETLDLDPGEHVLVTPSGEERRFQVTDHDMKSILNPTESVYAIWYVQYGEGTVKNIRYGEVTTSIGNDVYTGPMKTHSEVYIQRQGNYPFRFGLDEAFPDVVYVNEDDPNERGNPDALIFGKIYRAADFKAAYPALHKEYMGE
ncbi:hypothetical protein [Veillonella agrestimuris]|uniref:hypothetical protein n=1 Tax=Veillonella agrestimuris TaxID=2941340 RepID=UPI00203ED2BB|nr:hypothetical protein [Veillonella agrestimuris]